MGLFDGAFGGGQGILPDWLFNPQLLQDAKNAMDGGTPAGSFADRWSGVPQGIASGQLDPQGMNNNASAYGMPPQAFPGGNLPMPQPRPPQAQQAYERGLITPGAELPPMAQPTAGGPPQGGGMPSIGGLLSSLGIGSAQAQSAPGGQPSPAGPLDRLQAAGAGFFNAGSPMEAVGNLFGGAITGKRQDARGYAQDQQTQNQADIEKALIQSGIPVPVARAAALNPEILKTIAPNIYNKPKFGVVEEGIGGTKQYGFINEAAQKVNRLAGGANDSGGQPLMGQDYLDYLEKKDPTAAAMIKAIHAGDAGVTGKNLQAYMPHVQRVYPGFEQYTYDTRKKTALEFAPGGKSANNIKSLETVGGHIDKMMSLFDNLGNEWNPTYNTIKNWLAVQRGKGGVNSFETAANGVANELGTVFRSYGMSDAEVKSWRDRIGSSNSPEAFKEGMSTLLDMLKTRKEALAEQHQIGLDKPLKPENFAKLDAAINKIQDKISGKPAEAPKSNLPRVNSPAEAAKLPKGSHFLDSQGNERVVP